MIALLIEGSNARQYFQRKRDAVVRFETALEIHRRSQHNHKQIHAIAYNCIWN